MGFFLGGLISLYCGLKYFNIFGGIGCLLILVFWNLVGLDNLLDILKLDIY